MKTSLSAAKTGYLPTLDGWRAVAIIAVMISHAQYSSASLGMTNLVYLDVASWGRLGVDLFFSISGFLICTRLLEENCLQGKISLLRFYHRRTFRILPLYLLYLFVLFVLAKIALVPASWKEIRDCLTFCRNYANPNEGKYTNHFWSLSVEEHFYLLWPCLLVLVGTRRALWIAPALALVVHIWRAIDARLHLVEAVLPQAGQLWRTDTRIDALLWGCFAALCCYRTVWRFPSHTPMLILVAIVAAVRFHAPALPLVFAVLFPLLIISTVSNPAGFISRFLELPPLRWIGRLSYSLYIWQTLFLQSAPTPDPGWLAHLKQWPLNLFTIVTLATASYYLVEQPFIRLGRRCLPEKASARADAVCTGASAASV